MKKLLIFLLAFSWVTANAQTFPVTNLTVSGTSVFQGLATFAGPAYFTGQTTFNISPVGPTPTYGDSSSKLATTSFVAASVGNLPITPTVPTNAALKGTSTNGISEIWRFGFNTLGDVSPLLYEGSLSACPLSSGAGDNGDQVSSSNGGCWYAQFPAGPLDVRQWGVVSDGSTDNTIALQAAWTYGGVSGTDIVLPSGDYTHYIKFSSLTAPIGSYIPGNSTAINPLSGIRGRGVGQTVMGTTVTGSTCAITFNPASGTYSNSSSNRVVSDFQLISEAGGGNGYCLNQITGIQMSNFSVQNFNTGIYALDAIKIRMDNPRFIANTNGVSANTTGKSYPNQWVIINPYVTANTSSSLIFFHGTDIDVYGGDFEGNDPSNGVGVATIEMYGSPINGQKGLSIFGGYYENNGGDAEFEFVQLAGDSGGSSHSIIGVEQGRISNTLYTTNAVRLVNNNGGTGQINVDLKGSAFWSASPYTPNSSRPYLGIAAPGTLNYHITGYDSNYFLRNVEAPFLCSLGTNCMNLPDGHIQQWGTATTGVGTPSAVAINWPLTCPTAVDSITAVNVTAGNPAAVSYGAVGTGGTTLYSAAATQGISWNMICH